MRKTLKVLAALGITSCVAYVVAQSSPVRAQNGQQGAIAAPSSAGKFLKPNGAQNALREYIMAIDNRNVALANAKGQGDIAQKCVDVQCYYWLTTMRPDERKNEIDNVWQVSKYRPNGQWNHITSAPILVDQLLKLDDKTSVAIQKILEDDRDAWMKPFMEQSDRVAKQFPGKTWKTMTAEDKERYMALSNAEREKWLNGRTSEDVWVEHAEYVVKTIAKVKQHLTDAQRAEFEKIATAYDRDMAKAFAGQAPSFGTGNGK